jgi:hypothetical protein
MGYSGLTYRWERARRALLDEAQPALCPNLLATWGFAAALILPLPLACLVIAVAGVAEWPARKIVGTAKLHRYVYSTAGAMLSAAAVRLCLRLTLPYHAQFVVAMFVYLGVGAVTVALAMLSVGEGTVARRFSDLKTYYLEFTTMLIAIGEVALLHSGLPTLAWLSLPATIALQRQAVRADLRAAEEPGMRPMNQDAWLLIAREVIAACPVGAVMRVDTADPAAVNYLARVQAGCDAIGMAGDSGLAVLLTECPGPNADALAVRLRSVLHRQGIEAQVAVAAKPRDGQSLDDLLAVSEAELIARVAATRVARSDSPEA